MFILALSAAVAAAQPYDSTLAEANHAVTAGRLEQARALVGRAMQQGATGEAVELVLADIEFATGRDAAALTRYESLLRGQSNNVILLEHAGIAAARLGRNEQARAFLDRATSLPQATWRAWNARGAVADRLGDWDAADRAYEQAASIAPQRAEIHNNLGWSLLARGRWAAAVEPLERAATLDPKSGRIAANLDLARMAAAQDLPQRRAGESDIDWAARLNDAGMMAKAQGDTKRAIAAFSRAVRARSSWYERAANNLASMERK